MPLVVSILELLGIKSRHGVRVAGEAPENRVRGHSYTPVMIQELLNDGQGRYLVTTATGSHYVLDLTARTIKRRMAASAPVVDYLDAGFSQLRRDEESLELLILESCAVGASARFWIQIRNDHIPTLRMTSPVVRIDALNTAEL